MARYDAGREHFSEIRVLGKPALFHDMRIDRSSMPKGLYLYEVRHDDDGFGDPVQIAKEILVNHFGSIITRTPIKLPAGGCLDIDPEKDWDFGLGNSLTVKEFLEKYPSKDNKEWER